MLSFNLHRVQNCHLNHLPIQPVVLLVLLLILFVQTPLRETIAREGGADSQTIQASVYGWYLA